MPPLDVSEPPQRSLSSVLGPAIVGLVIAVFLGFVVLFWQAADDADSTTWARVTYVFAAVEAIAFAAAGWYFGSSVQRERVNHAEALARQLARQADAGRALAALILAKEGLIVESEEGYTLVESQQARNDADEVRREYADAARLLFPYAVDRGPAPDPGN
jgi:hypothetical protein